MHLNHLSCAIGTGAVVEAWPKPAWFNQRKGMIMSTTTLLILVVVLFILFGGGGGYYWNRGRH